MWNGTGTDADSSHGRSAKGPAAPISGLPQAERASGRRYLALWFPFFPTDRARASAAPFRNDAPDEPPFALVIKESGTLRLSALDAAALRQGLSAGMTLAEARALLPTLVTGDADLETDAAALRRCAATCEMFTPLVALAGTEGLILDITGCAHLFGGEEAMLQRARRRFERFRLDTRAAIAATPEGAFAFSRFRPGVVVAPGGMEALARELPIAALACAADVRLALSRAGFRTLRDLADRPSSMLAARFGAELVAMLRRILGQEDIRITPLRAVPESIAERHFPEPVSQLEGLAATLERLAEEIVRLLERRGAGGRAFEVSFFRVDGAVRRLRIETAAPLREARGLMRLIRLKIETMADPFDPGFGFDAVRLCVMESEPLPAEQAMLETGAGESPSGPERDDQAVSSLIDRLIVRFGRENVLRFIAQDTHDPLRAGRSVPWLSRHAGASWPLPEEGQPPARPLTLFEPPQLIEAIAEVPDGPPLKFRWRRVLHEVARAEGPERIAPEWWREGNRAPATRDYYRIENALGHRFWLFREGFYEDSNERPRWFLHGLFA
jgi:protein ImuB